MQLHCHREEADRDSLIKSYFNVIQREMIDMVPKAISLNLVNHCKETLQQHLLMNLYQPNVIEEILKESPDIVSRRRELVKLTKALQRAEEIVATV